MNVVRERVLEGINPYVDFSLHRDLISFCVDSECFEDMDEIEENENVASDFNEVIVVVEKQWLFNLMRVEGTKNPLRYLQEEYTSDDSYEWFLEAKAAGKIVLVGFH